MSGDDSTLPPHAVDKLLRLGAEPDAATAAVGGVDLGRYRLVRELGRGGMGHVFEAEDPQLQRRVALKVIPETAGLSETLRKRFAREAQAAARLSHPHIASVYDATPDYIAMQCIDGCTITDAGRDPRRLAALLRDAARAVHYAHEQGIVHRDLKPSNLMVEDRDGTEPRVFVLDFGLAKAGRGDSSLSLSGSILGTPAFMPPEQAEGRGGDVGPRSDVYALGATLYACLTGKPPFEHQEVLQLLRQVVERDAARPGVDRDLDAIVLKCLSKEPARRYASAAALADDLQRWLDGATVQARPPSLGYRAQKFVARRKPLVAVGAVALVVAAGFGVVALQQRAARAAAERAVELASRTAMVLTNAEAHLRAAEEEQAFALLGAAIADWRAFLEDTDIAEGRFALGRLLHVHGRRVEARAAFDRALALDPGHDGARFARGLLLLDELDSLRAQRVLAYDALPVDYDQQAAALEAAVRRDLAPPATADLGGRVRTVDRQYTTAQLAHLDGDDAAAERGLLAVLALDPEHGAAKLALARLYLSLGRPELAAQHTSGQVDLRRGFAPVFLSRGAASEPQPSAPEGSPWDPLEAVALPGLDAPVADAERAFASTPTVALRAALEAQRAMGAAAALPEDTEPERRAAAWRIAAVHNDAALKADPDLALAYYNRAVCGAQLHDLLRAAGDTAEAVAAQARALEGFTAAAQRAPRFVPARLEPARLRRAQAQRLARLGRFAAAVEALDQALGDARAAVDDPAAAKLVLAVEAERGALQALVPATGR